jgi:hypothetical protein
MEKPGCDATTGDLSNASRIFIFHSCLAMVAGLLVSWLTSGCQHQAAAPKAAAAHHVRYQLDWAVDHVERAATGSSWEVVNDLGYRVHVNRGYVVSYSMELVECPRDVAATPVARLGTLLWSAVEATAYAGHSTGTPNPAAIRAMQVESLTAPTVRDAGVVMLSAQTYCQVHYLVARANRDASGLPAEIDMVDSSLHIDGTYQAPGGSAEVPFTVHTAAAYGALFDHIINSSAPIHVDTGDSATQVIVRRHLGKIFDAVDFAQMKVPVIANQILNSLIDHVEIEINSVPEEG